MLTSLDEHFSGNYFERLSLDPEFVSLSCCVWQFLEHRYFTTSQGRVATHLRCGGIFNG